MDVESKMRNLKCGMTLIDESVKPRDLSHSACYQCPILAAAYISLVFELFTFSPGSILWLFLDSEAVVQYTLWLRIYR